MDIAGVVERVERVVSVRATGDADAGVVQSALVAVREIEAWCAAQHAGLVGQLRRVDSFPEQRVAEAARASLGQAVKSTERSATLDATPKLAGALSDGVITAGHVDAVTRASKHLEPGRRGDLLERVDALADVAAAATVAEFARRVALEAKRLQDGDGMDRLERQRRAVRARTWIDDDGMWNLKGRFDPVTGLRVDARLRTLVEALFTDKTPEHCPADPIERQQFLLAHALASLADSTGGGTGRGSRSGRPEFVVVIDADATGQSGPVAEFSIPVELPARVLADLAGEADVSTVVVRNGVVLYAPGDLDLGRTTRLANRAQRRALRGFYTSCGIPGCSVHYDRCKLHHVIWWRHGGRTDLANLIPLCSHHHSRIHNDGWVIELGPNRELTLTLPDGTIRTTGPPNRRTAA